MVARYPREYFRPRLVWQGVRMFEKIQHIGCLVADLDAAVDWFKQTSGGDNAGREVIC